MEHRKKMTAALGLFLVCVLLMAYTSYAWLVVSTAPEVSSIETNVGANGSLEVALLNDETFADPTRIRTAVGDSLMSQDAQSSNITWGNVIDLSTEEYGLQEISLRPSRLNLTADEDGNHVVGNNMLMVADFGTDGRVSFTSDNTVSGVFGMNEFAFNSEHQTYGVRGIGVAEQMSLRQKAFAAANSLVPMYNASAIRTAQNIWRENGAALMNMWERKVQFDVFDAYYTEPENAAIRDMAQKTLEAYEYVDRAISNAMIGVVAMEMKDEDTFAWFYEQAMKTGVTSYDIVKMMPSSVLPDEALDILATQEELQDYLKQYLSYSDSLVPGEDGFIWNPIGKELLEYLGFCESYLNGYSLYSQAQSATQYLQDDNTLVLNNQSVLSALAKFTDNYSISFSWGKRVVEVSTVQTMNYEYTPLIPYLNAKLTEMDGPSGPVEAEIFDLYGFAIDMAFRCNATTDLLLQTEQELRLRETTEAPVTQGGGSYVRFRSDDMTPDQVVKLVDTIRLGFMDNRGHLVALAKPNTSNYREDIDESIIAPLYLYEFTVSSDGVILPGERRSEDASILPLTQSSPEHLTTVIWMDGDYVDNSMVSFVSKDMLGVVNLQFASSVDLTPASIGDNILANSAQPSDPLAPSEPGTSTEPSEPSIPTVPAEPGTSTEPSEPSTPTVPAEPGELIEYDIHVGNTRITSHNASDVLGDGTVSYDAKTNTLTLNGAAIEGSEIGWDSGIYAGNGLNLVLGEEASVIQNAFYGIDARGPLTITGGSLTMQGITGTGIRSYENDIIIDCDEFTVFSEQQGLTTSINGGTIFVNRGKVALYGGEVFVEGNGTYGLASTRTVLGNECHLIATGALQAAHTAPELAPGASGKSRTSASRDFVSGIFYNKENYFEFAGSGSGADIPSGTISVKSSGKITDEIYWAAYSDKTLHISGSGAMPDDASFRGCDYIWVEIDEGITVLGRENLTYDYQWITIPESLVCIGAENGWQGSSYIGRLKQVTYAGSPRQWEAIALIDPQLNVLFVQGTVTTAKENAPLYRSGTIPSTNMTWSLYEDGILIIDGSGEMPDWTETNGSPWSSYKSSIKAVIISDGITKIGAYAFYNHSELKAVTIPGGAHSIHAYAFADCENLLGVSMGENSRMQTLGENCFMGCSKLQCIGTMEELTTVGDGAFRQCTSLTDIPQAKDS